MNRRDFVKTYAVGVAAAATPATLSGEAPRRSPAVHLRRARPLCVSDVSSIRYKNGGPHLAEFARRIDEG